jgi:formate dehydrogenase subunit gamma
MPDRRRAALSVSDMPAPDLAETVDRLATSFAATPGALLPLLHALQLERGHISEEAIPLIAKALNLSRAEVHGVVSFYHDFRRKPAGVHVIKLCRAESCQARGGAAIERSMADRLGVGMGETSADGRVTLEPIYCLGLCATGPNALIDGEPLSRIDAAKIDRIAAKVAA